MIGFHFQRTVNDWPRAVASLPPRAPVKAVDSVQLLGEARAHNPTAYTILRHWYDHGQVFNGSADWRTYVHAAQVFLRAFVDGTFDNFAQHVSAIEGWNEYIAWSHTAAELADRAAWCKALCEVWKNEFSARYPHVQVILTNTAVGNDIPQSIAELAKIGGAYPFAVMGYHAYWPVRDGVILSGEWPHYSGRWEAMDNRWRSAGIRVRWAFTEAGPVYIAPEGHLDGVTGWRSPLVYGSSMQKYADSCVYWLNKLKATHAYNDGRILGAVLFTTGGGPEWASFETRQPEMDHIASTVKAWAAANPPGPPPPPPPPPPTPRRYKRAYHLLPQSATTAQQLSIAQEAYTARQTVGFSVDDAFSKPPEVTERRVFVYNVEAIAGSRAALEAWVQQHYPGTVIIEYRTLGFPYSRLGFGRLFADPYTLTSRMDAPRDYGPHEGADYDVLVAGRPPVLALHAGTVTRSQDSGGYGQHVVIRGNVDGYQFSTWYAHLSERFVTVGQAVAKGQPIGKLGDSGNTTGDHVHINLQIPGHGLSGYVVSDVVDPAPWVPPGV